MKIESPNKTYETEHSGRVKRAAKGIAGVVDNFINRQQDLEDTYVEGSHEKNVVRKAESYRFQHNYDTQRVGQAESGADGPFPEELLPKGSSEIAQMKKHAASQDEESGKFAMKYQDALEPAARAEMEHDLGHRKAA